MKPLLAIVGLVLLLGLGGPRLTSAVFENDAEVVPTAAEPDTSVIVRRIYEGPAPDFWGTSPSPDGRYVTQTDWITGDLAVLDLLTGVKRRLTGKKDDGWVESVAYSEAARFSPDGHRIAYSWATDSGTYELRVINSDGTDSRVLIRAEINPEPPPPLEWWPDLHGWSSDGRHLLATLWMGWPDGGEVSLISVEDGSRRVLHSVDDGKELRFAALSPDGAFLAFDESREAARNFSQAQTDMDVYVLPIEGGRPTRVVSGPSADLLLGWTPSGNLLFYSDRELTEGVWMLPMRGGRPTGTAELVKGDLWGMQLVGTAGPNLVFGVPTETSRIQVAQVDLERDEPIGPFTPIERTMRRSSYATWSPDGIKLMYWVVERERLGGAVQRLMLRSVAGGDAREVALPFDGQASLIRWNADGRRVLLRGVFEGQRSRRVYDLETGTSSPHVELSQMETGFDLSGVRVARLSDDWRTIYFLGADPDDGVLKLVRREIATGDQQVLAAFPDRANRPPPAVMYLTPSPDGSALAMREYHGRANHTSYRVVPTRGGESRTFLEIEVDPGARTANCSGTPLWTRDSGNLVVQVSEIADSRDELGPTPCQVYRVPIEGGDPEALGSIPENQGWTLHPDDTRLAITTARIRGEFWILESPRLRR